MGFFSQLAGTFNAFFQIGGTSGPRLKSNAGSIDARNAADSAYVNVRALNPVGDQDVATKQYVDQLAARYICTAQISGVTALPANTGVEHFIVVTTTGGVGTIGQIYWDDGTGVGNVTIITLPNGALVSTPTALSGGTITFAANTLYMWDTSAYFNVAGSPVSGALQCINFAITTGAAQSSVTSIPSGAVIVDAQLKVTTPYSAGTTIKIGQTGTTNLYMDTTMNDPLSANTYDNEQNTPAGGSALPVLVTIAGAPAAGVGVVTVLYSSANP